MNTVEKEEHLPSEEIPTPPDSPPTESNKWLIFGLILLLLFSLGSTAFLAFQNYHLKQQAAMTQKTSDTSLVTPEPAPQNDYSQPVGSKTYNNNQFGTYDYQIHYPSNWKVNNISRPNADVARFTPLVTVGAEDFVLIECPTDSSTQKELSNPYDWEGNEGGYHVKYFKRTQINGFEAIQYVWGAPDINTTQIRGFLRTEILRDNPMAVCTISTSINEAPGDTAEKKATAKVIYQQVVSSFKYGNNDNLNDKTHCVVTGNRGQLCMEANQEPPSTGELPVTREYECLFDYAICERQDSGNCGWTFTEGYNRCMGR